MEAYSDFAQVYDLFMDNVDYDRWAEYLVGFLKKRGLSEGLVCELGCGTGNMTERLAAAGYDMIGIDSSPEMLEEAMEKKERSGSDILYLMQDMREFELYGTVGAVISVCDCINYITEEDDLREVFRLVNNYLDPGGLFLFDLNTEAKYKAIGSGVIAENREEGSFIWENIYDEEQRLNEYMLTIFIPEKNGLYRKHEEIHLQRAWRVEEVKECLREAGMEFVDAWKAYTDDPLGEDTERMHILAREKRTEGKFYTDEK